MHAFYSTLPIQPVLPKIAESLAQQDCLILSAEPGAGKSTAVPLYLLEQLDLADKKIVMLEPRRLAAKSIATFLASLLGEEVGQTVGYQVRNERKISAATRLEIVTEGVLTNRIVQDPELHGVGLVIFDEFHERSIHADFGLSLCKDIRSAYNESLKLLVMSATIDAEAVSGFLDGAEVIHSEGRCFPVATEYVSQPMNRSNSADWLPALNQLIVRAAAETAGDVLVFLPGQAEIKRAQTWLNERLDLQRHVVFPLYGSLNSQAQQQALKVDEQGRQKIVLATNIAETSLTIANISAVVDSGWERVVDYEVNSGMTRLLTQRISQASAEQRQGRAGRVQAGHCYRLWTETQQQSLKPFLTPEIASADLTSLRLAMAQWGVKQADELEWLTPPPPAHFAAATELLQRLELLKVDFGLSKTGLQAVQLNTDPRLARLLIEVGGRSPSEQSLAADLVAVLMDSHFYYDREDADLSARILALQAYRKSAKAALKNYPIKASVGQQVLQTAQRLQRQLGIARAYEHSLLEIQQCLGLFVALAYPDRIAKKRTTDSKDSQRYLLANGRGAVLSPNNRLGASSWLAVADLDGQKSDGRIFLATELNEADIETAIGFSEIAEYRYEQTTGKVRGVLQKRVGRIVLQESQLEKPDLNKLQSCLKAAIVDSDLMLLPWKTSTQNWLQRVRWLKAVAETQTQDWPDISLPGLVDLLDEWLMPYLGDIDSVQGMQALDLESLLKACFDYQQLAEIEQQAPEFYQPPAGKAVSIEYRLGQLPKVSIILQSLFGELRSPQLAWGQAPLAFELLSPARRPIQTTSDLEGFWQGSYFDVAKEMKGRYPKHRWPEKPLEEQPGKSIKS